MATLEIVNLRTVDTPNCCANCKFNDWDEEECHCINPLNWQPEEDEDRENMYMGYEGGEIEWDMICDNFERGSY